MTGRKNTATLLLVGVTVVALYVCYLLFRPYVTPILFASVIAIVFYPLHKGIQRVFRSRNIAALVSTVVTLVLTVVPLTFLLLAISHELTDLYRSLATKSADAGGVIDYLIQGSEKMVSWAGRHVRLPSIDLQGILLRRLEGASAWLVRFGASLISNAFSFVANAVVALVILFFLFRDGETGTFKIMAALPFPEDRLSEMRAHISSTVVANFYGGVAVGALQGTLTGISFWALGLDSPVLWGVVTGFFSLVPVVGSAMVWAPASVVLLLTGHSIKAIILLALGVAVIGTIDNVVRPLIIGRRVRLHAVFVFFALLGGVQLFGVLGLFVGPVILSITAALLMMLREDLASRNHPEAPAEPSAVHAAARSESSR
jgi:predicted PurR-regulated permease PerM